MTVRMNDGLAAEIETGFGLEIELIFEDELDALESRAAQYSGAYWTVTAEGQGAAIRDATAVLDVPMKVRRRLEPGADHCETCPGKAQTYDSWDQMLSLCGGLPGDGSDQCHSNCRCYLQFEDPESGEWRSFFAGPPSVEPELPIREAFIEQKTVRQAERYAREQGFGEAVSYKGLDVRAANEVNRALYDTLGAQGKSGFGRIETAVDVTGRGMFAGVRENQLTLYGPMRTQRMAQRELTQIRKLYDMKQQDAARYLEQMRAELVELQRIGTAADVQLQREVLELLEARAAAPQYLVAESPYEVVMHEVGHKLQDSLTVGQDLYGVEALTGQSPGAIAAMDAAHVREAARLSEYASQRPQEYFAEAYLTYMKGQGSRLTREVRTLVERAIADAP